jgi:hypothetical protein
MNHKPILFILLALIGLPSALGAQAGQDSLHPSLSGLRVAYKSAMQAGNTGTLMPFSISAIPVGTIAVKPQSQAFKFYVRLVEPATDSVLYSANYYLSDSTRLNISGIKLFENNQGTISFSTGEIRLLRPYRFEVYTADTLQQFSPVYSKIQ